MKTRKYENIDNGSIMQRLLIAPVWLAVILFADARSSQIRVTPGHLDTSSYSFSVSTNSAKEGIYFHVTITAKAEDTSSDWCNADLKIATRKETPGGGVSGSIGAVEPPIPVTLKKGKRVWGADFTVSHESLKKPGLCFVFKEQAHS